MARRRGGSRLYRGVFRLLEGIGLKNARARWESQSPFLQRAVPPLVIAALVILVMLPVRAPRPSGARPARDRVRRSTSCRRRWRRWALPATILAFAIAYPFLIQQTNYQRFLFEVPIFNSFPSIDTMAVMAIFAMMAVGLNMVVGYAGLLDLGYVAFYALGAYTAAGSPRRTFAVQVQADRRQLGGIGVTDGLGGIHISIWVVLSSPPRSSPPFGGILIGLPTLRLRGDYLAIVTLGFGEIIAAGRAQRRQRDARLQPDGRAARDQPDRPAGLRRAGSPTISACPRTTSSSRPVRELREPLLLVGDRARS